MRGHESSKQFLVHQMKILCLYIGIYVLVDFTTSIFFEKESALWKETLFLGIMVASIIHDLKTGPSDTSVPHLEENIMVMSQILIYLFIFIFGSACLTNQFISPVEVEILYDDGDGGEGQEDKWRRTVEYTWEIEYKGFNPLTLIDDIVQVVSFGYFEATRTSDHDLSGFIPKPSSNVMNAFIHLIVDATKVVVARFLIVEGELIGKLIFQFYTAF